MTDLNIAVEDQNRLAELLGEWTQNQYLLDNYVTMNIVDAVAIGIVLIVLAFSVIGTAYMVMGGSKLEDKIMKYHLNRVVKEYEKDNPYAENYTWKERDEACKRTATTMRLILLGMLIFATVVITAVVWWGLTVYGPMGLQSEILNTEAQMQVILDRQTGPDAVTLEEYLSRYR